MTRPTDDAWFRRERARLGAHAMHATHDAMETTKKARANGPGSLSYWRKKVDPDKRLDVDERERRAEHAKKAHYARLAMLAAKAKAAKR